MYTELDGVIKVKQCYSMIKISNYVGHLLKSQLILMTKKDIFFRFTIGVLYYMLRLYVIYF